MTTDAPDYFVHDAVRDLRAAGLDVELRAYGFHLLHEDTEGTYEGECGGEHDWSVSLSLRVDGPPVRWYFRYSIREMADFIGSAYAKVRERECESLGAALEYLDRNYDHEELSRRLEARRTDVSL
jgi:hypothetical protein